MATDHAVSDHSTNEQDDKKINEEIKTIEQDGILPTEKNEITDSSSLAITGTKSEENVRDDQIKPPVLVEVETVKDAPNLNVPVEEKLKVAENPSPESGTSTNVAERAVEVEKDQEGKAAIESSENHPEEQPAKEAVDKQPHNKVVMEEAIEKQPVTGHVEKESEVKSVIESMEKQPEEQPTTKNFGKISEEKSAIEAIEKEPEEQTGTEVFEKKPEEKIVIGSIERQHEEQPATEAVDKQLEKAAIESIEKQPEQQRAAAVVERQREELMEFESTQKRPQDQAFTKTAEKQPQDKLPNQPVQKEPEEQIKVTDVPHLTAKNLVEHLEVSPPKEEEPKVVQEPEEVSEAEVKITEQPASINKVRESPEEQSEVTDQIEKATEELKPKGMSEGEVAMDEKTLADKVGESLKELQASKDQVPDAFATSDKVFSTNQEAHDYPKKDGGGSFPDVVKNTGFEDAKKEDHGEVVAGGLSKGADMQEGKIQEKKEEKDLEVDEETEGKNVKNEKSSVEEKVSRVAEVVPEKKRLENVEDDMPASAEANENRDEMVEDIKTASAKHVEDFKKSDLELEAEETKQAGDDKLAETQVIGEIPKSDVPDLESSKDKDLKNSGEAPKEEVTIKHTQKQSNNLISRVKHSLAKVKKAITGKSPSSKNLSSKPRVT